MMVTPEAVAESMEKIYKDDALRTDLANKAFTKFSGPKYSWKNIANTWDKIFEEVT